MATLEDHDEGPFRERRSGRDRRASMERLASAETIVHDHDRRLLNIDAGMEALTAELARVVTSAAVISTAVDDVRKTVAASAETRQRHTGMTVQIWLAILAASVGMAGILISVVLGVLGLMLHG